MRKEIRIIGKSRHIRELLEFIKMAAGTDANVLLLGETGVGKELAARMIHSLSDRKNKPFEKINCANLNENLLESQLFGHKKGAYTGADFDKLGLIEEAQGGVFFFDEIGDITPYIQAKLLEAIERKKIRRLGENAYREVNVRFIFATNKDLRSLMQSGKFRTDLYYRINILTFYILPLSERKTDIPLLIDEFLGRLSGNYNKQKQLSSRALGKLIKHDFPGNVRELEHIIERAYICSKSDKIKSEDTIIEYSVHGRQTVPKITPRIVREELRRWHGNKTRAAEGLAISRQWLHKLIKRKIL